MSTNSKAETNENNGENLEVAKQSEDPETPDMQCSICLNEIINVCYTDMCRHSFCYACLTQWLMIKSICPLCKTNFNSIRHSFTEDGLYQVLEVTSQLNDTPTSEESVESFFSIITRAVFYHRNMWAEPLSDSNGRFRGFNSRFYIENRGEFTRLSEFIHRELYALLILQSIETDGQLYTHRTLVEVIDLLLGFIINFMNISEILAGHIALLLRSYIHHHALHFCYELYNFANSPYDDVYDYYRNVRYSGSIYNFQSFEQRAILDQIQTATRMIRNITIFEPDSDNEEDIVTAMRQILQEMIVLDSSSDESSVEIAGTVCYPIETNELPSVGQQSTSTGTRHLAEPSNNRSDPMTRRFSSGGTRIVDCSSTGEQQTIVEKQSYSDSSSSDDEDV